MKTYEVPTHNREEMVDITSLLDKAVSESGLESGVVVAFVPHTTAGVTINENADPDVVRDMLMELEKIVPFEDHYAHREGNSAAHIKASFMGSTVQLIVDAGRLILGTWQGIYFCEFDGPRRRTVYVQVSSSATGS